MPTPVGFAFKSRSLSVLTHSTACILSARQSSEDDSIVASDLLKAGRKAGFDALVWQSVSPLLSAGDPGGAFGDVADRCADAGLRFLPRIDLHRFRLDDPLVEGHPDAFTVRRDVSGDGPVDPRRPMPATGEALARLRSAQVADLLEDALAQRLMTLVEAGAGGFHFVDAGRIAPALLARLIARLRAARADLVLLAGPPGEPHAVARGWREAGFDFVLSSFAWWDMRAPWLAEEYEALRMAAPLLSDLGDAGALLAAEDGEAETRLDAAAAMASGLVVPLELVARGQEMRTALKRAVRRVTESVPYGGEMRHLSSGGAAVSAFLRAAGPDLRDADRALLVLANGSDAPQPVSSHVCGAAIALGFDDFRPVKGDADLTVPLGAGELRMMVGKAPGANVLPAKQRGAPSANAPRLVVEDVTPSVAGGDFPVKRVVGDTVGVEATVFADGHEQIAVELRWRAVGAKSWSTARMKPVGNDRWTGAFIVDRMGRHEFEVVGWLDTFGGFRRDFAKKLDAEVAQPVDHAEGVELVKQAAARTKGRLKTALEKQLAALDDGSEADSARILLSEDLAALMDEADERPHMLASARQLVDAERIEARFSSWYELFPRSITDDKERHGTFRDVIDRLPAIRAMGFDTLYFPPIHPIGRTNRKGPNNTLTPGPDDPGSPYAIGGEEGGHDALHPALGSFEDFGKLVAAAREHGLEIALDFAIQASPDHPWLTEHPGWFAWRPDGSMKYAENPPKKYQDIVNVDFYGPDAIPGLWKALRDVVLHWIDHGVKTFRVDNPHTKPLPFWEWMIADIRGRHPDAIFLSEAFTRPTMMYRLAKVGFSQSYTYFTWRDAKHELIDYIEELTQQAPREFYRPHFFVNTPDINPVFLQHSGRPGFLIRAVLASTLSGLFGVYSGFEHCEATPLAPGKEEYLDSEKYEIRPRPERVPGDIVDEIAMLNRLRRAHSALQTHLNTRFYLAHNDHIIWYGKPAPDGGEMIMVMVNLDPRNAQGCDFEVPLWEFGLSDDASIAVEDIAAGHRFDWTGKMQSIRIAPDLPYRLWRLSAPERLT